VNGNSEKVVKVRMFLNDKEVILPVPGSEFIRSMNDAVITQTSLNYEEKLHILKEMVRYSLFSKVDDKIIFEYYTTKYDVSVVESLVRKALGEDVKVEELNNTAVRITSNNEYIIPRSELLSSLIEYLTHYPPFSEAVAYAVFYNQFLIEPLKWVYADMIKLYPMLRETIPIRQGELLSYAYENLSGANAESEMTLVHRDLSGSELYMTRVGDIYLYRFIHGMMDDYEVIDFVAIEPLPIPVDGLTVTAFLRAYSMNLAFPDLYKVVIRPFSN
jgi:hypothetical protein